MGKTALVTGGSAGIGAGIAKRILSSLEEGDRLLVNYGHSEETARAFLEGLPEEKRSLVELIQADMSSEKGIDALLSALGEEKLTYLVCNTGISTKAKFEDYTMEEWDHIVKTNLTVPTFLVQRLLPRMEQGGSILFVGSYAGQQAYSASLVYGVTKAGIHFLTKSLVKETEKVGVRVNAIAPGFIETRWHAGRSEESRERIEKKVALHRFGTVEEVADMAFAVLTNGYMNGSVVDIHGGYDYF
ncbi:MAG: SDR family oxidoreductase [Blautia sp.]|nr:SDR family oxidoreductase [Blautia sp.]